MADPSFEMRLQRMFAEHPHYPDAPLFAVEVENRLSRGWAVRRLLIGAAGAAGGVLALVQFAGVGLGNRLGHIASAVLTTSRSLHTVADQIPLPFGQLAQLPFGGEVLWLVAGLAVLAGALLVSRSIQEI
jgi:hypothetical protein